MILSGLDEAMYYWWNGDKARTQEVLQRQKNYADEVAELTGEHLWQVIILRVSAEIAMRDYDYERVREYTETLIGLDDGKAIHLDEVERVYNALAIVYFSLGEYDKMEACFEKAIAQAADSAFIVNVVCRNYADLLGEIGQTDRAIQMLEELTAQYREAGNWLQVESLYSLSRLWLNKGDKQRAERYMREADELFAGYKESSEFDPATEASLRAHKQVLEYAKNGTYHIMDLVQFLNRWSETDYVRYRVAEAKERSIRDLRERNLYLTISRQRQMIVIIMLFFVTLGGILLFVYLYRRRQRLLLEKEEEIETLRNMLASADKPDDRFRNNRSSESEIRTGASQPADGSLRKLMLQQLGVIKTIAGTPTEANQQLLARLMALNEETANALIDWPSIYQTIDLVYDGFYTRLVQKYGATDQSNDSAHPVLNEKELQLCCLLKADFSTKEINMLTRQSLQTIYQRKTQVRQKLSLAEAEDITTAIK
jgi:tetratricopeptide (TPR) repeat protein